MHLDDESERKREREKEFIVAVAIYLTLGSLARLSRCVYVIIHKPRKGAIIIACSATTPRPIKHKKSRTEQNSVKNSEKATARATARATATVAAATALRMQL